MGDFSPSFIIMSQFYKFKKGDKIILQNKLLFYKIINIDYKDKTYICQPLHSNGLITEIQFLKKEYVEYNYELMLSSKLKRL